MRKRIASLRSRPLRSPSKKDTSSLDSLSERKSFLEVALLEKELAESWRQSLATAFRAQIPLLLAGLITVTVSTYYGINVWREQKLYEATVDCTNKRRQALLSFEQSIYKYINSSYRNLQATCQKNALKELMAERIQARGAGTSSNLPQRTDGAPDPAQCFIDIALNTPDAEEIKEIRDNINNLIREWAMADSSSLPKSLDELTESEKSSIGQIREARLSLRDALFDLPIYFGNVATQHSISSIDPSQSPKSTNANGGATLKELAEEIRRRIDRAAGKPMKAKHMKELALFMAAVETTAMETMIKAYQADSPYCPKP